MHLGHFNIIKYCNRPFTNVNDMNNLIIDNWNKVIRDEDTVINLGDLGFGFHKLESEDLKKRICSLKGKVKILIRGNHDKRRNEEYVAMGFKFMQKELVMNQILFTHRPASLRSGIKYNVFGHIHNNDLTSRDYSPEVVITDKHKVFTLEHHYSPILLEEFIKDDSNLALKRIKK